MKPAWLSLTCFTALVTGVLIGRHSFAIPSSRSLAGSAARPGGPGASAKSPPAPNLITQLKQPSGIRRKTTLMLSHLANGGNATMRQFVEAAGNDVGQLLRISDIALHTDPAGFMKTITKKTESLNAWDTLAVNFAKKWAKADFNAAFATSRDLPYPVGSWMGGIVLETRLATDPTSALKLAVAHPELRFQWNNDLQIPASPENVELVRALPPSMGKFAMITALSDSLPMDQTLALVYEDNHTNPYYGAYRVSEAMIKKDPQEVQEWVLVNPDHPARSHMARRVGDHLIKTNPAAAVEWATTHLSGMHRTKAMEKAAAALQKTDPAAADAARALLPASFKAGTK